MRSIGVAEGPYLIMVVSVTDDGIVVIDDPIENTIPRIPLTPEQTLLACEFMLSTFDELTANGNVPEEVIVNENEMDLTPFTITAFKLTITVCVKREYHKVTFIKGHNHQLLVVDTKGYAVRGRLAHNNGIFFDHLLNAYYNNSTPFSDH